MGNLELRTARLNIPNLTNESLSTVCMYAFTSYALRRDLEFIPGIFGTESSNCSSVPSSPLVSERNSLLNFLPCLWLNPRLVLKKQRLPLHHSGDFVYFHWKIVACFYSDKRWIKIVEDTSGENSDPFCSIFIIHRYGPRISPQTSKNAYQWGPMQTNSSKLLLVIASLTVKSLYRS